MNALINADGDPHEIVLWKPSIFGPTYRVPRWALDLHRTLDREARMALARAEALPAGVPGWARRERAERIRSAMAVIDQLRRAVLTVGMWTQEAARASSVQDADGVGGGS